MKVQIHTRIVLGTANAELRILIRCDVRTTHYRYAPRNAQTLLQSTIIELPQNRNGNRYCITLTDCFSKWPEAEAIPTNEAKHVAAFLYKMILCHGCPEERVSDQGHEFYNQLIDLLELTGFKHKIISAYPPDGDWFCFTCTKWTCCYCYIDMQLYLSLFV